MVSLPEKRLHVENPSSSRPSLNLKLSESQTAEQTKTYGPRKSKKLSKIGQGTEKNIETSIKALDNDSLNMKDNILNKLMTSNLGRDYSCQKTLEMFDRSYPFANVSQQQKLFNFPMRPFPTNGVYSHPHFMPSPALFNSQGNNFIPHPQQFQKHFEGYSLGPSLLNFTANYKNSASQNSFAPNKTNQSAAPQQPPRCQFIVIEDSENEEREEEGEFFENTSGFCSVTIEISKDDDAFKDEMVFEEEEAKIRKTSETLIECSKESSDCPTDFIESPNKEKDSDEIKIKNTNFSPVKPFDHVFKVVSEVVFRTQVKVEESEIFDDNDSEDGYIYMTPVGEEFQVSCLPDLELDIPISENPRRRSPKLKWDPKSFNKEDLDQYYRSLNKIIRKEITNEEVALGSLRMCSMDVKKTLDFIKQNRLEYRDLFAAKPKSF